MSREYEDNWPIRGEYYLARDGEDGPEQELESPVIPGHRHHWPALHLQVIVKSILRS